MTETRTQKSFLQKYHDVMPKGAGALFLIQIFATMGFSVLYSTLILYATRGLHMSDLLATSITGSFVALNYFLHLLGGYIGGRFLSYRSLFGIGMVLQIIGCVLISFPTTSHLLWGLAVFLSGAGLNVTCINCMVTQLFEPDDKRRESAFLWNYSGMNIGFFIGFFMGGYFHLNQSYQQLFLISAGGNIIALLITLVNWATLKDRDTAFMVAKPSAKTRARVLGFGMVFSLVFILRIMLEHTAICNQLIMVIGACMLIFMVAVALQEKGSAERSKLWGFIILSLSSVIFWTLYQLAPMGLNLFIDRNVDRHFMGMLIAPQWVQNINTVVIIIGGPFLSFFFSYLREKGLNISIPLQFSMALVLIGVSLAILPVGILFADANGFVNFNWVIATFVLMSVGELFISPIGYAMVGQLAPVRLRGVMMGIWMMIIGVSAILSDYFSKMALGEVASSNPLVTNPSFSHTFNLLGWTAIAAGVALFVAVPFIARLTQEKRNRIEQNNLVLREEMANASQQSH